MLFYTPDIDPSHPQYFLNEEDSKHCIRVLRLETGSEVQLIDGRGGLYYATIRDAHPKRTILQINTLQAHLDSTDSGLRPRRSNLVHQAP